MGAIIIPIHPEDFSDCASEPITVRMDAVKESKRLWQTARLMIITLFIATLIRAFFFANFVIPSQSMMPRLLTGDMFVASKWDYGWSRYSFSSRFNIFEGRVFGSTPEIGDVVIFAGVKDPRMTYIKRVMGHPGDTVEMRNGIFILNNVPMAQDRRSDLVIPITPNLKCLAIPGLIDLRTLTADARPGCKFYQARETLPSGRRHLILDFAIAKSDNFGPVRVPAGHLFMLGDNRDDSLDSRFSALEGGVGMVPIDRLLGRARYVFLSSDGTGAFFKPWTWQSAFRGDQLGEIN